MDCTSLFQALGGGLVDWGNVIQAIGAIIIGLAPYFLNSKKNARDYIEEQNDRLNAENEKLRKENSKLRKELAERKDQEDGH